ncbi:MAG: class I SAM-dependent methyltransferase [Candidatus Omnitrophica bacterium]|nr:class I SAM-dependent methyltransferase [Candidatus Omnitrophota bacterium]
MKKEERIKKTFPWGTLFAARENFEFGYFTKEKELVDKYLTRPSDVLVLGSGNGREAFPIHANGHSIVCIDNVTIYLDAGRLLCKKRGIDNVTFKEMDVTQPWPFQDEAFDFIFFSIFSYIGDRRWHALQEARRVMRGAGYTLLSTATSLYPQRHPRSLHSEYLFFDNVDSIQNAVDPIGFRVLDGGVDPKRHEYLFVILARN